MAVPFTLYTIGESLDYQDSEPADFGVLRIRSPLLSGIEFGRRKQMSASAIARRESVQQKHAELENRLATDKKTTGCEATQASEHEEIAKLAYALWQQRGCPDASAQADWIEAEQQLLGYSKQTATHKRS